MKDKFNARLYIPGDAEKIKMKDIFITEKNILPKIESLNGAPNNFIYTCLSEDKTIGILGCTIIIEGVGDLWSYLSDDIRLHSKSFYKFVLSLMEFGRNNFNIHRYQMTIRVGNQELIRWAEGLKMKCEGLLEKFGPDKSDYFIFARVY